MLEIVDYLQSGFKYLKIGAKIPKGILLVGPPGTGKTLLAKICATEAQVPFYYTSASEFINGYIGMGAKTVKSIFDQAE